MKKSLLMGILVLSVQYSFAAWGWSSGSYSVDRYTGSTIGGQPAICLYIVGQNRDTTKYFIHNPESTASKALMSEIVSGKIFGQSFKLFYNGTPVEGDWFELGAVKQ